MEIHKSCEKCGKEFFSDKESILCDVCKSNHEFSIFLKNLIDSLNGKLFFENSDFIRIGIDEADIYAYIWELDKLNLITFSKGKFFIKLDEINKFIDENYWDHYDVNLENNLGYGKLMEVYDPESFIQNTERKNYKSDVLNIVRNVKFVEENSKIPFPQGDDLNRFIFLGQHLFEKDMSKLEIKELNQVHDRIVNMYTSVGLYFGVFERYRKNNTVFFKLSDKGRLIFQLDEYNRNLCICHCILEHKIFHDVFMESFLKKKINKNNIVNIMLRYDLNMQSMVTIERRAGCVSSWMHWIFRLMGVNF